jgi:hypothetical protein
MRAAILSLAMASLAIGCSSSDGDGTGANGGSSGSGAGGSSGTGNPNDPLDAQRQQCVDKINQYRATLGLAPYKRWTAQEACSDNEAKSDSQTKQPHGAFGSCTERAQNECPGWSINKISSASGSCLDMMWAEGPGEDFQAHGHYINMSSTKYTMVACGFSAPSGTVWAVQNFR